MSSSSSGGGGLLGMLPAAVRKVANLASVEKYGYKLWKQPAAWVVAVVLDYFVNWTETLAAELAAIINQIWLILLFDVLEPVGGAALVTPAEAIGALFVGQLSALNALLVDVSSAAGPFAPFVVIVLWALSGLFVAAVLYGASRGVWLLVKLVTGRP